MDGVNRNNHKMMLQEEIIASRAILPGLNSEEKETTKCERNTMEQLVGAWISSSERQILQSKISLCDCFMRLGFILNYLSKTNYASVLCDVV